MTREEEDCSVKVIEFCRTHFRKLGSEEFAKMGARSEDVAIAACYSAFDLASAHKGDAFAGIELARTALDVIERSLLTGETVL
ncbi:hypothetical protein H9L14_01970 [Sphingomonas sediminicola]|uniref:DUF357 domain-containing protein n=1 Tax=Sphingomonas sediminicola TaxID=386874 RepID=A0ABX6T9L3_9SPHN|nr:hypothetical protein [Sphingomonas sediminicola]QNP46064.1 hypothetical protein H9L14_01970 [Sphingomonas sediminicola]